MVHQLQEGSECESQHLTEASGKQKLHISFLFPVFSQFHSALLDLALMLPEKSRKYALLGGGGP